MGMDLPAAAAAATIMVTVSIAQYTLQTCMVPINLLPSAGEPLYAWCGPQPNSRLLLNYGIVDESNPYDKLPLVVTLPANDPLYKVKRGILQVRSWLFFYYLFSNPGVQGGDEQALECKLGTVKQQQLRLP